MPQHTAADFELRPAGEPDLPALVALYRQCEDFIRLGTGAPIDEQMVRGDLDLSVREGGAFQGIWLPGGALAGVLDLAAHGYEGQADLAFIILLMIGAPWRGQGLGAAVVRRVEQGVWANPAIKTLRTAVQVNNPRAVAFWERMGYAPRSGPALQPDGTITCLLEKRRGGRAAAGAEQGHGGGGVAGPLRLRVPAPPPAGGWMGRGPVRGRRNRGEQQGAGPGARRQGRQPGPPAGKRLPGACRASVPG